MVKLVKLFIVVFAITISTESFAQIFRVKAGVNFANMVVKDDDDNYSEDFKMKPGFHFGASAEIPIGELLAFEPGLLYSLKGFKFKEEDSGDEIVLTWNLSYIEIPLNLKATFDVGTVRIYTLLGPYIRYRINRKVQGEIHVHG